MPFGTGTGIGGVDVGAVVGNMEAAGVRRARASTLTPRLRSDSHCQIQRTPIVNRTMAGGPMGMQQGSAWRQPQASSHARGRQPAQRQPFSAMDGSFRTSVSTTRSDHSDSTAEVENLLAHTGRSSARNANHNAFGGGMQQRVPTGQPVPSRGTSACAALKCDCSLSRTSAFGQPSSKRSGPKFKPAGVPLG